MENRLVSTTNGVNSSFMYDPLGRLFQATIGGVVTQFLYDGDALVAEYNSSNSLTRRYVHGDQVDEPWVEYSSSSIGVGSRTYLHADHQGSIIARTDGSGGYRNKLTYDSFGIPATTNEGRFGYTGQIWFKELGLFHYKARMYSPKLGRFLQTDPIFYADQMNMYAYVGNDPVNMIDPTGLESVCANSRADACYSGPADFGANNAANKSENSKTPSNNGDYNFRKTDANPEEYNEADLINDGINSIVNSPDGIVRVRSDPNNPDSGYNIRKEGNTVSRDNLKATYEVISSNKVKINVLEGGAGVKSLTITSSQEGKIKIEGVPFRYRIFVKKTYE